MLICQEVPLPTCSANTPDADVHGQLFVATDAERSDCVHLLLGALQR